jgi:hypothetical protein
MTEMEGAVAKLGDNSASLSLEKVLQEKTHFKERRFGIFSA